MIIVTICKDDPLGLKTTLDSIESAVASGVIVTQWVIKLSSEEDSSLELCDELPEYSIVIRERDFSLYEALNQAIMNISDLYNDHRVMLLHARDRLENISEKDVETINSLGRGGEADLVVFDAISGSGKRIKSYPSLIGMGGLNFCHQAALFNVELMKKNPFISEYRIAGDYKQLLSLGKLKIDYFPIDIVFFDIGGISSRSVVSTRVDNFKAGYSEYGIIEVFRLLFMLVMRKIIR